MSHHLYQDSILLALTDASQRDDPHIRESAIAWLESDDDGFMSLNTACEHLAGTVAQSASPSEAVPQTPEAWKAVILAAYRGGGERSIQAVNIMMDATNPTPRTHADPDIAPAAGTPHISRPFDTPGL